VQFQARLRDRRASCFDFGQSPTQLFDFSPQTLDLLLSLATSKFRLATSKFRLAKGHLRLAKGHLCLAKGHLRLAKGEFPGLDLPVELVHGGKELAGLGVEEPQVLAIPPLIMEIGS